jgi:hypothetical protein
MRFHSILFRGSEDASSRETREPAVCFRDLHLDQIVAGVTKGFEDFDLTPFFQTPLIDLDQVAYRQEIMRDLEQDPLMDVVRAFSQAMRVMQDHLRREEKSYYKYEKERWFLSAAEIYCDAVERLRQDLDRLDLSSQGMRAFREYLAEYVASRSFRALVMDAIIMNEIFSSTTPKEAGYLGKKTMARISRLDLLGVCVTFVTDLASFEKKTVSVVSTVDPEDPAVRTYKLERRPAHGLAYALAIAELKFRSGVLVSAQLGDGNKGTNHVLRQDRDTRSGSSRASP